MKFLNLKKLKLSKIPASLFLFISTILNISCASHNSDLPTWVIKPTQDTSNYLYGIGQGSTLEAANTAALKNATSKLGVSISGTYAQRSTYSALEEQHLINDSIKIVISKTPITSFQQVKTQTVDGKFYTLIKIDKNILVNDYKHSLEVASAGAVAHIKQYNSNVGGSWLIQAKHIATSDAAETAQRYTSILAVLDPFYDLDALDAPWLIMSNLIDDVAERVCIYFDANDAASGKFADALNIYVKEQSIKSYAGCNEKILMTTDIVERMYYGMFVSRHVLTLALDNGIRKSIQLTSQSATSYEKSRLSNLLQLTENLHDEYLWETLGFIKISNQ
jgi:hypothetical protein